MLKFPIGERRNHVPFISHPMKKSLRFEPELLNFPRFEATKHTLITIEGCDLCFSTGLKESKDSCGRTEKYLYKKKKTANQGKFQFVRFGLAAWSHGETLVFHVLVFISSSDPFLVKAAPCFMLSVTWSHLLPNNNSLVGMNKYGNR